MTSVMSQEAENAVPNPSELVEELKENFDDGGSNATSVNGKKDPPFSLVTDVKRLNDEMVQLTLADGSTVEVERPDENCVEASDRKQKELSFLDRLVANCFNYFQTHVLTNASMLLSLQRKKALATRALFEVQPQRPGVWLVIFTPSTAMRFVHRIDQLLPYKYLAHTLDKTKNTHVDGDEQCDDEQMYPWHHIFFVPYTDIERYFETEKVLQSAVDFSDEQSRKKYVELREKAQAGFPYLLNMTPSQSKEFVATLSQTNYNTQVAVTLQCVDMKRDLCATLSFSLEPQEVVGKNHGHLERLAMQYYTDMMTSDMAQRYAAHTATMIESEDLSDEERTKALEKSAANCEEINKQIRSITYSYAQCCLQLNGMLGEDEDMGFDKLAKAVHVESSLCAHCCKLNAKLRCQRCQLFRYCDEECRKKHAEQGTLDAVEAVAAGKDVIAVPHQEICFGVRGAVRFWGQIPHYLTRDEFLDVLNRAQKRLHKAVAESNKKNEEENKK